MEIRNSESQTKFLDNVAQTLHDNVDTYSKLITDEMGKPISESKAEIEKCFYSVIFIKKMLNYC